MDSVWRTWLAAALLLSGVAAQQLSAQSEGTQSSQQRSYSLTMAVSMGDTMVPLAEIIALTRAAALDLPAPGITGQAILANSSNQLNVQQNSIALISCDNSEYPGNIQALDVFATAESAGAAAIVWYSMGNDWCDLSTTGNAYNWIYSMKSWNDTQSMLKALDPLKAFHPTNSTEGDGSVFVTITPPDNASGQNGQQQQQTSNPLGPSPGTAVAMIILYSITGIITALFLVIIVTGAVRAHRHPERYGPRNIIGRARQSRAKGLARAMLETIPIVKFGDREPPKAIDVELAHGTASRDVPTSSDAAAEPRTSTTATPGEALLPTEESATERRSSVGGIAAASSSKQNVNDIDNQGCSICTEDFEVGQDQRVLPCDHRFHPDCIDPWLLNVSGTCPLCRIDLRPQATNEPELDEHGNPIPRAEGAEGEDSMPPPLGQPSVRRSVMMGLMGIRRPDRMSREERVLALRRYRQQAASDAAARRRAVPPETSAAPAVEVQQDESGLRTRLRSAFRIRTRRTGQGEGN
ncbi:hypothetical protein LTR56_007737 [Elasticomyces elasticus]|nr:hypothetical protein LTR56_007737 [Elasticomyces elasticus]KAK3661891.1 hypothetical protein LTR22_007265 [Elasticomyces elasticus]KAK4925596.1 hypothetical protein LTR49_007434 [Elasticomyces elasticus]KAK5759874.1 hypothetical protein LTS12_010061 [Elasticomyces elasticus]